MNALHFGAPWFFAGLLLLIVPFLMLLTKAQTKRITEFSSLAFLKNVTEKASNILEWKRLLLLLTRLLILFCLTAAFTLPFLGRRGEMWGTGVQNRLIFILDNSYSMGYGGEKTLFDEAKDLAGGLARKNKKSKTWFSLYTLNTGLTEVLGKTADLQVFLAQLRECPLSSRATSYGGFIAQFREKIDVDTDIPVKVFILSDFSVRELQLRTHFENSMKSVCPDCVFEFIPVRPESYRNFSIRGIHLPPRPFLPHAEEIIKVSYRAFGMAGEEVRVSLSMEETEVASQKIKVPESGEGECEFRQKFPAPGYFPVKVQSGKDALAADNTRYALMMVHDPLRVLMIEARDYPYPFENPYFYFTQALQSAEDHTARPWIDIAKTLPEGLKDLQFSQYDLIAAADVPGLDVKSLERLLYYVKEGGTVFFAAGKNFENFKDLNNRPFVRLLGGGLGAVPEHHPEARLSSVNYEHPLFRVFDYGRRGNLGSVGFHTQLLFIPQEKNSYEVLAWGSPQKPALIEIKRNEGRFLLWTSSLNAEWNDFPKSPLYVPFVFELIRYAALRRVPPPQNLKAGESLFLEGGPEDFSKPVTLRNPKGEQLTLYRDKQNIPSLPVDFPGFYQWMMSGKGSAREEEKRWAVVNVDAEESRPEYLTLQKTETVSAKEKSAGTAGLEIRFFIYRPFLYALFILLAAETWFANRFYKPQWV